MKKIVVDFLVNSKSNHKLFENICEIKKQITSSECSVTLTMTDDANIEERVAEYLSLFAIKFNCVIEEYSYKELNLPIYNPKTYVDYLINHDWATNSVKKDNAKIMLNAFFEKYKTDCYQCDIDPNTDIHTYAEKMLNLVITEEDQREIFYKFIVS